MSAIVRTDGLVKRYAGTLAVAGVDLDVEQGEIFGLVGPNGAGKTTTLRMLATLLAPTAGEAEIAGARSAGTPTRYAASSASCPTPSASTTTCGSGSTSTSSPAATASPPPARRRMIGDLLELVDLADKRDAYVQALSRGMQQRLCLAHALVHDPQVLLLDEPASGLDPRARVELRELLRELRSLGKTIVISSHILPELEELCTCVAIIDHGQVLAQGRVADIERRLRFGAVLRVRRPGRRARRRRGARPVRGRARRGVGGDPSTTARSSSGSAATTPRQPRLLAQAVAAGIRIASFARAASDLEELFLQVTAPGRASRWRPRERVDDRSARGRERAIDVGVSRRPPVGLAAVGAADPDRRSPRRAPADGRRASPRSASRSCAAGCAAGGPS